MIRLTRVCPQPERIIQVARSASGFHKLVIRKKTDLIAIAALSLWPTLPLPTAGGPWQRRRNKQQQRLEAIKANRQVISQALPRPHQHLFSSRSLVMNLLSLAERTVKLDRLEVITSLNSLKAAARIHSRSAQLEARPRVARGGLVKPPNPQMVSSIRMRTSPPTTHPAGTTSSHQSRPLGRKRAFASLTTETASPPAT